MDCFTDEIVGATAADVGDGAVNVSVAGNWFSRQQGGSGHDHAGLTIAALRNVYLDPCLLDGMRAVRRETFDGGDRLASDFAHSDSTGAYGASVDMNGTGPALLYAAAVLGPVELEVIPQRPEQWRAWCHIDFVRNPVYFECNHELLISLVFSAKHSSVEILEFSFHLKFSKFLTPLGISIWGILCSSSD